MSSFKELLQASFKSNDTEEWLDVHFTRPIGLVFALFWNKLNVHPNTITVLSIFLGVAAGYMFYYPDTQHNIMGVVLLMFANFCDSTDGQMARLTGKKTLIGRMLDGFSGDVWFACIYLAIAFRLMNDNIPNTDMKWGLWIWAVIVVAGILCHSPQSSLSDYYRQIHLFFLKGKSGSELDSYEGQKKVLAELPAKGSFWARIFYSNYAKYCHSQEKRTPEFQKFFKQWNEMADKEEYKEKREQVKNEFLAGSRPLMPYINLLTFNLRAIVCYVSCLINHPWIYPMFEIVVMSFMYIYMHSKHEKMCASLIEKLK